MLEERDRSSCRAAISRLTSVDYVKVVADGKKTNRLLYITPAGRAALPPVARQQRATQPPPPPPVHYKYNLTAVQDGRQLNLRGQAAHILQAIGDATTNGKAADKQTIADHIPHVTVGSISSRLSSMRKLGLVDGKPAIDSDDPGTPYLWALTDSGRYLLDNAEEDARDS
jgi:hypothetical protein